MQNPIEVGPQPRIDVLVNDAATGAQLRRTTYAGTVWFGGRPQISGSVMITRSQMAILQSPFFLPDSLPYRAELASGVLITITVAVQSSPEHSHHVASATARLEVDPRNPSVAWLQVQVQGAVATPTGISYRVEVVAPPLAVLPA